ncbi:hypothetical protein [Legionella drancourtii]|uniref:hypothetical protein n=1 Tax=Legionella drancourtii TaxID=168933 RepID=UPI0013053CE1|nr:hypothetical protein [Legionella drancourtii]
MKAINQEGQKIIDESLRVRRNNKLLIIDKILTHRFRGLSTTQDRAVQALFLGQF